jgi:hypothetical protein
MSVSTPLPPLAPRDAFFHVINDHRWLAVAAYAWKRFGPAGSASDLQAINEFIPGIGVLIQDSLLLHARALVDFYTSASNDPTDIVLRTFNLAPLSQGTADSLDRYKDPISVHLMHLTAWRDLNYRATHRASRRGVTRFRIDWNQENAVLVDAISNALSEVASRTTEPWHQPFGKLEEAVQSALADPAEPGWPTELTEKPDVDAYLGGLGL